MPKFVGEICGQLGNLMERKWWTLLLISIATFMLLLDITVVNVALPDIQRDLNASLSSLQWVVDAYSLTLAAFLLTAGSLGDRLGRRRVFSLGFGIFTLASFLCGIAGDPTLLNLARGLQGVGGAAMFATSLALIAQEFHGSDRATAFGVWGATIGGAVAIGPLVGGLITEHLGWEWIFFVNIPIGVVAIALVETPPGQRRRPGPRSRSTSPGLLTFSLSLFLLIFGLIRGNPEGWGSPLIVACLVGAAAAAGVFVAIEHRSAHPMLDLTLFRKPAFNGVSAVAFCLSAGMFALFLYLTIYLQGVLAYEPLQAGLRFLPLSVTSFVVAPIAARLGERIPARVILGSGLATVGVGLMLMRGVGPGSDWTALLAGLIVAGIGIGITNPGIGSTAIAVVPVAKSGMGFGYQHDLPPGRDRHRRRRARRGLPVQGGQPAGRGAASVPRRDSARSSPRAARRPPQRSPRPGHGRSVVNASTIAFTSGLNEILLIGASSLSFTGAVLGFALTRASDFVPQGEPERRGEPEPGEPVADPVRA